MKGVSQQQLELEPPKIEPNPTDTDPLLQHHTSSTSDEIIKEDEADLEASSVPCCRICLESDAEPGDDLIAPCMCKGTQQFVHRSCLDHWRSVKVNSSILTFVFPDLLVC